MFVADKMTRNPVTIAPDAGVDEAAELMKKGGFRRLPVVEHGKLVGFFSNRDLLRAAPSAATTLDKFEVRSLLAKIKVAEVMPKKVFSINEDATIEEAALLMYREKIGGLPVISSVGAVVGVITETDIFKAFIDIMGIEDGKVRLTLHVAYRTGVLRDVAAIFTEFDIDVDSMVALTQKDGTYEIIIRADIDDLEVVKKRLWDKGFKVTHVTTLK